MERVFKILRREEWHKALVEGVFSGSKVDIQDGFIHLSTAVQAAETAARHFSGQTDLILAEFVADRLGEHLKWEISRDGQLFPHLYAALDPAQAVSVADLPWDGQKHCFP
jgi:uncharacterized protein (DUF952 family)